MSFTFVGGQAVNAAEISSEKLSRQLNVLLADLDAADTFPTLRASDIFRRLLQLHTETAAQALRKTSLKCQASLSSGGANGFRLALLLAEQVGWSGDDGSIPKHAQDWLNASLNYLVSVSTGANPPRINVAALSPLLTLLQGHLLSPQAVSRPEFARAIVANAVPKVATVLTACVEIAVRSGQLDALLVLFDSVVTQLDHNPASLRPFAPRLHAAATKIAFTEGSAALRLSAIRVLGHLHLTGAQTTRPQKGKDLSGSTSAGKTTQGQLWLSTVKAVIGSTRDAWEGCMSTFDLASKPSLTRPRLELPPIPETDEAASWARLQLLLGEHGVLPQLLSLPTKRPVALPLTSLIALSKSMLAAHPAQSTTDANLHATQSARLPHIHMMALGLLTVTMVCAQAAGLTALARFSPAAVELLVQLIERPDEPPVVRASATQVLASLMCSSASSLPLNPASELVLRANKACISQIASLMVDSQQDSSDVPERTSSEDASTSARKKKRSKLYESDSISAAPGPRLLALKPAVQRATAISAMEALPRLYSYLLASLTPTHYDLAHTSVQVVCALADTTLRALRSCEAGAKAATEDLGAASLRCLAGLLQETSAGPMLGLLTPKLSGLVTFALGTVASTSPQVAIAAVAAAQAVRSVTLPRLPPVLSGHADEEDEGGQDAWASQQWGVDPSTGEQVLASTGDARATLSGDRSAVYKATGTLLPANGESSGAPSSHAQETAATREPVAAAGSPSLQPRTQAFSGPRHSSPGAVPASECVEPLKPLKRPTTPRIGSPSGPRTSLAGRGAGSPEAREVFGRQPAFPERAGPIAGNGDQGEDPFQSTPTLIASTLTVSEDVVERPSPVVEAAKPLNSARVESEAMLDDSDDEEMPDIDIGSSDEEE
ncbi:unnamed protein product [Parajaminaea phylloscopi]